MWPDLNGIQQLLARTGKSGDAAGILTLFAHMAELEARLTTVRAGKLDNLDALISSRAAAADYTAARAGKLDLIGAAADAAGTTSLFARLAQIADYVDTVETKLGLNTDAAGTTTLFARLAQIAGYTDQVEGYTDTLEANLGTTADAANAAGTVLARLAELLTNRLTAGRAAFLDAAISSRASSAQIGTSADTRASNTVMGWQATQVKSWQRVVFTPTASPYNVAITSVNTAKCIFIVNGAAGVILSDGVNYTGSCNSDYCISEVSSTAITIICSIVPGGTDRLMRYGSGSLQVIEFY